MYFNIKDPYRAAVEAASGGRNTVIYDDKGFPSVLVCMPKFNIEDVTSDTSAGTGTHPAFIFHGKELPEIWVGKYISKVVDGRACSLAGEDPTAYITHTKSVDYCRAKGKGWHLMSRAEWAAIALQCNKAGFEPRGNNNTGKDIHAAYEHGVMGGEGRTLTGSGPASWAHDGTPAGIMDMNGNIWEWQTGMKTIKGRIYVTGDDGIAMNNFDVADSDGSMTGFIDTKMCYNGGVITADATATSNSDKTFATVSLASGVTAPASLRTFGLLKTADMTNTEDWFWCNKDIEALPLAGGAWGSQAGAGVWDLLLSSVRSYSDGDVGCRVAYAAI